MSEAGIRATFTMNVAEHVAVSRCILWRAVSYWFLFGLCVILPLSALVLAVAKRTWQDSSLVLVAAAVAVLGAAYWWFFPWIIVRRQRRGNANPSGPFVYVLDGSAVRAESPVATTEYKWVAFQRARETDRFFLLYTRKHLAHCIPKRVLAPGDSRRIRNLISGQLGDRAQLLESE